MEHHSEAIDYPNSYRKIGKSGYLYLKEGFQFRITHEKTKVKDN